MYNIQIWKDHVITPNNTFDVTENADGSITLTPKGEVLQQGTNMSASNFNNIELGIADGDLAQRLLTIALNNVEDAELIDYIFDQGYSGSWFYRKWASGFAECVARPYFDFELSKELGGFKYGITEVSLPFTFKSVSSFFAEGGDNTYLTLCRPFAIQATDAYDCSVIHIGLTTHTTGLNAAVSLRITGRWK